MQSTLTLAPLVLAALVAAGLAWLGMAATLQKTSVQHHGYMHWVMPILLLVMAAGVWLSGRDLTTNFLLPEFAPDPPRPALLDLLQPLLSLLLLAISGERILSHFLLRQPSSPLPALLPISFVVFWLGSTASPALLGAHPAWSHDLLYPLIIGLAASLASRLELDLALRASRNALLVLMLAGIGLVALQPTLVMDRQYGQGLIPGLPRFGGLATHPVSMGLLAQLALILLLARPLQNRWANRAAWLLGLAVLLMAQSKTAWLGFVICSGVVIAVRRGPHWKSQFGQVHQPTAALAALGLALLSIGGTLLFMLVYSPEEQIERFLLSSEGSQLSSLTGRDRIWAIAWQEWQDHPVFGWGPQIWGEAYRRAIAMSNATHAHNQFMDTLSRAGLVGATALLGYLAVLGTLAVRGARASQGLSLALLIALLLRAGSEVPLLLIGYGPDLIAHLLLLMTLAAGQPERQAAPQSQGHTAVSQGQAA